MPMPRELTTGRNADAGLTFLRHSGIYIRFFIITSVAVYGRAGCITFLYLQFGRALGIPFTTTNTSSMDVLTSVSKENL